MPEYRRGAHTIFEIHLHLVWITKYRRPALTGDVAVRVRDLVRDICGQHEVKIMKGHVAKVGSRTGAVFRRSSLAVCSPFPLGVPH